MYNSPMSHQATDRVNTPGRRPSRLSERLAGRKIEDARRLTPEERLRLAIELSDACFALKLACSSKR